jgi:hypothetical protein
MGSTKDRKGNCQRNTCTLIVSPMLAFEDVIQGDEFCFSGMAFHLRQVEETGPAEQC